MGIFGSLVGNEKNVLGEEHFSIIIILDTNISHQHRESLSWSQTQIKMT